jgi:hypothetical protein
MHRLVQCQRVVDHGRDPLDCRVGGQRREAAGVDLEDHRVGGDLEARHDVLVESVQELVLLRGDRAQRLALCGGRSAGGGDVADRVGRQANDDLPGAGGRQQRGIENGRPWCGRTDGLVETQVLDLGWRRSCGPVRVHGRSTEHAQYERQEYG